MDVIRFNGQSARGGVEGSRTWRSDAQPLVNHAGLRSFDGQRRGQSRHLRRDVRAVRLKSRSDAFPEERGDCSEQALSLTSSLSQRPRVRLFTDSVKKGGAENRGLLIQVLFAEESEQTTLI